MVVREGGAILEERSDILESEQPPEEGTEWVNVNGFLQQASQGIKLPLHANSSFQFYYSIEPSFCPAHFPF